MIRDSLGDRMKEYESRNQYFLQKRMPVIIRLNMRAGHSFTKGFKRPFDEIFMTSMQQTMKYLCKNIQNCKFGYTQSDEITLILLDYENLNTDCWFNYRTDKLCAISASMATLCFNRCFENNAENYIHNCGYDNHLDELYSKDLKEYNLCSSYRRAIMQGATFDSRCFNIPKEEVTNCIYWRQLDAIRNSIQMVGQANFSHKELQGKSCNQIRNMLLELKGINWDNLPITQKCGAACIKKYYAEGLTSIIINTKDDKSDLISICREKWCIDTEMPILKEDNRWYIESIVRKG